MVLGGQRGSNWVFFAVSEEVAGPSREPCRDQLHQLPPKLSQLPYIFRKSFDGCPTSAVAPSSTVSYQLKSHIHHRPSDMSAVIHTAPAKLAHHRRQDLEIFSFFFFSPIYCFFFFIFNFWTLSFFVRQIASHSLYITSHLRARVELFNDWKFLFFFFQFHQVFSLTHSISLGSNSLQAATHAKATPTCEPLNQATTASILHSHRLFSFKTRDTRSCLVFFQPFFTNFFPADRKTLGRKRAKKTTSPTHQKPFLFSVSLLLCLSLSYSVSVSLARNLWKILPSPYEIE